MDGVLEFFRRLFDSSSFQPRQTCAGWWNELMYMHIGSDLVIWLSYMAIPVMLIYFVRKRPNVPFPHIFMLFGAFIMACGTTHLLGALAFSYPMYRLDATIKIATALVSAVTAITLIPNIPRFLALRSPEELEREILERKSAESKLYALNQTLEQRVLERTAQIESNANELERANQKLQKLTSDLRTALDEQARLAAILEATPDIVSTAEPSGRVSYLNRSARKLFNIPSDHDVTRYTMHDFHDTASNQILERELIPKALEHGAWSVECKLKVLHGTIPVSEMIIAHRNTEGKIAYLSTIARDLSDIKRTEDARHKMELQVQHVQRLESLGVLAGGIAHDFNNLLMAILGNADMAFSELPSDSPVQRRLQQIEKTARRAAELTQQMLAYSGKGRFTIQPIDLNVLIDEMISLLRISISKNIDLKLVPFKPLPAIEADASQIRQVLMNLITNASDAIGLKPGLVVISTSVVVAGPDYFKNAYLADPDVTPGSYVCIEVDDTGCGMSIETMAKIFDPFYTTKFTGRGLGLAAVLGIVRGHKGAIAVYSEVGKGTTFRVHFPASSSAASTAALEAVRVDFSQNSGVILVVDDEAANRELMSDMLRATGYQTILASDGVDCMQRLLPHIDEIAGVVLDATMPRKSGVETYKEIRAIKPDMPILVVSGFSEEIVSLGFETQTMTHFLQKPFAQSQFLSAVRRALHSRE